MVDFRQLAISAHLCGLYVISLNLVFHSPLTGTVVQTCIHLIHKMYWY